ATGGLARGAGVAPCAGGRAGRRGPEEPRPGDAALRPAQGRGEGAGEGAQGGVGGEPAARRDRDLAGRAPGRSDGAGRRRAGARDGRARGRLSRGYFSSFFGAFFLSSIFRAISCTPDGTFLFRARSFTSDSRSWERNFIATGSGTFGFLVSA